jgi:hypothetical protein
VDFDEVAMNKPENHLLKLTRVIGDEIKEIHQQMATKNDVVDVRSELKSMREDVASDMTVLERRVNDRIAHLNHTVMEYRSSSVGYGRLMGEFDKRLRWVEQHLNLPPVESY